MTSDNVEPAASLRCGPCGLQRTPDPFTVAETQAPLTPRPRLRLKLRQDPNHLAAPTRQFLASVAAADIPVPSVEEPTIASYGSVAMRFWNDSHDEPPDIDDGLHIQYSHHDSLTCPKTPASGIPPSLSPSIYPKWTRDWMSSSESSPEPDSRPSTARSHTSTSSFGQLSSCSSDDEIQFSPRTESSNRFMCDEPNTSRTGSLQPPSSARIMRKTRWTRAMTQHLWATYNLYLSDPCVTPFQIGKNGIPPGGVSKRVARQAIRSWKGSKAKTSMAQGAPELRSGSSTPNVPESSGVSVRWPCNAAATRAHLRLLCKQKARGPDSGKIRFNCFSRSPTPLIGDAIRWGRRGVPSLAATTFGTQDLVKSLAMTTSETMAPEGPLTRLITTTGSLVPSSPSSLEHGSQPHDRTKPPLGELKCLGSPVSAKSYGPSSSGTLSDIFALPAEAGRRQSQTVGALRTLQSPVRLDRFSTHKRKTGQAHEYRKRPSLAIDTWLDPQKPVGESSKDEDVLLTALARAPLSCDSPQAADRPAAVPAIAPPRLGSPFSASNSLRFSVPNRLSQAAGLDASMFERRFATVHQPPGTQDCEPATMGLASPLAYLDQRLNRFNTPNAGGPNGPPDGRDR